MVVSRSDFQTWKPAEWSSCGNSLKEFAADLTGAGDDYTLAMNNAAAQWEGTGSDGALDRTHTDVKSIDDVVEELNAAGGALVEAGDFIEPIQTYILDSLVPELESNFYVVHQNWVVEDVYPYTPETEWMRPERVAFASKNTVELQSEVGRCTTEDTTKGPTIATAIGNLNGLVKLHSGGGEDSSGSKDEGLSGENGKRDAEAILDGTATPEQIERFKEATNLSQEQLDALRNGEKIEIPREQFDYLEQAIHAVNGKGELDAFERFGDTYFAGEQRDELKRGIADAINIVSNPSVSTPRDAKYPPDFVGPVPQSAEPKVGGIERLPDSFKQPLTSPPASLSEPYYSRRDQMYVGDGKPMFTTLQNLDRIASIQSHSSEGTNKGSDVNRAMIARAGEIAKMTNDKDSAGFLGIGGGEREYSLGEGQGSLKSGEIQERLNNMLTTAGRDEIAVHDIVATGRDGGPERIADIPGGTYGTPDAWPAYTNEGKMVQGDYNATETVKSLLNYDWHDNPGEGGHRGIEQMFKSLSDENAAFAKPGEPVGEATVAGETSSELARILADNKDDFLNIEGYDRQSIGDLNPNVTQVLADAVGPQMISLAGGDGELVGIHGADQFDNASQMKNLFTVLDTDTTAASIINTHAADSIAALQSDYMHDIDFSNGDQAVDSRNAEVAGRISNGMSDGLMAAADDMTHDERWEVAREYYENGVKYDMGRSVIKVAADVSGNTWAKAGVELLSPIVKDGMIGQAPYTGDLTSDEAKAAIANAEPEVYGGKATNTESFANFINGLEPGDPALSDPNLSKFLDDQGNLDRAKVEEDPLGFRSAADHALGVLDDEWTEGFDRAEDNIDWKK